MEFISPIIPMLTKVGLSHSLEDRLADCGFFSLEVGYPVVAKEKERVRVIMHADNSEHEVDSLVDVIVNWAADLPN
jgi:8-amino-7-oxononanoate synthase